MKGRVLIIAGSDPSGGAGVQADIKTVTALGGYAAAAITAITVQNTVGVKSVHAVATAVIGEQIIAVLEDIGADVIKIGMIGDAEAAAAIIAALDNCGWRKGRAEPVTRTAPIVLDPVLAATSGDALASEDLASFLVERLVPRASLVMPNTDEAQALVGFPIRSAADQRKAGARLVALGAEAALIKGGHMHGPEVVDVLVTKTGVRVFQNPRITTTSTHGTGCTLASAVATGLAQGMALEEAVGRAIAYVREAIRTAPGFGAGAGPLNHAHCRRDGA